MNKTKIDYFFIHINQGMNIQWKTGPLLYRIQEDMNEGCHKGRTSDDHKNRGAQYTLDHFITFLIAFLLHRGEKMQGGKRLFTV